MKELKDRILICVDRGLEHLGESIKQVIYWHLENKFDLKKDEIPDRPEEFMKGLEEMYGSGAYIIEKIIIREMAKEFQIRANDFIEAVRMAIKVNE